MNMSFIQSTIKCDHCGYEMNVATGTFGHGLPQNCPQCNYVKFSKISDGWNANHSNTSPKTSKE